MTQPPTPGPHVHNSIEGTVLGPAVQAGSIHGGVHFHAPPQPVGPPVYVALPPRLPPRPPAWFWPFVGKWVVALLPLLGSAAAIGAVADAIAQGANIWVRLLLDVMLLALGVLVVVLWSALGGRGTAELLELVLDKVTPRELAVKGTPQLVAVLVSACALSVSALVTESLAGKASPGANGALLFFLFLVVVTARLIARRV
ncbi:hypothetical protein ACWGE0_39520 [Lentzea sp. NPDC054927]